MECRYLHRDFPEAQALFHLIMEKTTDPYDRGRVYKTMVILYTNMGMSREAVDLAVKGLAELGVAIPRRVGKKQVLKELREVLATLRQTPKEDILTLPRLEDPLRLVAHELYMHLGTPLFF